MSKFSDQGLGAKTAALAVMIARHGRVFYTGTGFPQLFEREEPAGEHHFDNTWLYLPSHYLQMIVDQTDPRGERTGIVWGEPLLCDDRPVFPLVHRGEVVGAVSSETPQLPEFDAVEIGALVNWCQEFVADPPDQVRERCATFVRELFRGGDSAQMFMKRALSLLTNNWERSCAGSYADSQGTYWLNIALGDVSRWFRLQRQFYPEAATRLIESVWRQEYFVPADSLGDYPALLDVMPDFLFVHEAMLSPRNRQFMVVAGPGTISRSQAVKLKEYARLVSGLQEFQFSSGSELIEQFSRLSRRGINELSREQVLTDTWNWLSQQISLSRMALLCRVDPNAAPCGMLIQRKQDGETELARIELLIPRDVLAQLLAGKPFMVEDVRGRELDSETAKERYIHHILSEYYVPLQSPDGVIGVAVFSAPNAGDYLGSEAALLDSVAAYLGLWLQMERRNRTSQTLPVNAQTHV